MAGHGLAQQLDGPDGDGAQLDFFGAMVGQHLAAAQAGLELGGVAQDAELLANGLDLPRAVQTLCACLTEKLGAERAPSMTALTIATAK